MASIKTELTKRQTFKTRDEARLAVLSYIEAFYNPQRRHSALGYLSAIEYEKMLEENCIKTVLAVLGNRHDASFQKRASAEAVLFSIAFDA